MNGSPTLQSVRQAAGVIRGFRKRYVTARDAPETLLEFAAMLGLVGRLSAATGVKVPSVVRQGTQRFARKPGEASSFNYIRVGGLNVYFGVKFRGASGADHAPDVVVAAVHSGAPLPLLVVECKHYPNRVLSRTLTDAFIAVLVDLNRPRLIDAAGSDVLCGVRYNGAPIIQDPILAQQLSTMKDAGWSFLETTCIRAPRQHGLLGARYGFVIHTVASTDRLI